jgi:hypothetical protein
LAYPRSWVVLVWRTGPSFRRYSSSRRFSKLAYCLIVCIKMYRACRLCALPSDVAPHLLPHTRPARRRRYRYHRRCALGRPPRSSGTNSRCWASATLLHSNGTRRPRVGAAEPGPQNSSGRAPKATDLNIMDPQRRARGPVPQRRSKIVVRMKIDSMGIMMGMRTP